jgi:hypothetical protein
MVEQLGDVDRVELSWGQAGDAIGSTAAAGPCSSAACLPRLEANA